MWGLIVTVVVWEAETRGVGVVGAVCRALPLTMAAQDMMGVWSDISEAKVRIAKMKGGGREEWSKL